VENRRGPATVTGSESARMSLKRKLWEGAEKQRSGARRTAYLTITV